MLCTDCLFYESSAIVTKGNQVVGVEYCHYDNGKYNSNFLKVVQSILVDECDCFKKSILLTLYDIQEKYDVTILFAVESGSRAWGWSNEDSDFDVRFVFRYNNLEDYLRLDKSVEVISFNDGLYDFVGWDIGKALKLHSKSNPSLREWLLSDTVYVMDYDGVFDDLPVFEKNVLLHHYFSMGVRHWERYCEGVSDWLGGNDEFLLIKKYLYVLRCILTWQLLKENRLEPKINIFELLYQYQSIDNDSVLREDILLLLEKSIKINNNLDIETVDRLNDFIVSNLEMMDFEMKKIQTVNKDNIDIYNKRYYDILNRLGK